MLMAIFSRKLSIEHNWNQVCRTFSRISLLPMFFSEDWPILRMFKFMMLNVMCIVMKSVVIFTWNVNGPKKNSVKRQQRYLQRQKQLKRLCKQNVRFPWSYKQRQHKLSSFSFWFSKRRQRCGRRQRPLTHDYRPVYQRICGYCPRDKLSEKYSTTWWTSVLIFMNLDLWMKLLAQRDMSLHIFW